jgi:hypothetical protein
MCVLQRIVKTVITKRKKDVMLELKLDLHTRSLFSIGCLLGASWEISKHFFRGRVRGQQLKKFCQNCSNRFVFSICCFMRVPNGNKANLSEI